MCKPSAAARPFPTPPRKARLQFPSAPHADADVLPDRVGTLPQDAFDAALSVDDPDAASADELAIADDSEDDDDEKQDE